MIKFVGPNNSSDFCLTHSAAVLGSTASVPDGTCHSPSSVSMTSRIVCARLPDVNHVYSIGRFGLSVQERLRYPGAGTLVHLVARLMALTPSLNSQTPRRTRPERPESANATLSPHSPRQSPMRPQSSPVRRSLLTSPRLRDAASQRFDPSRP